MSDEPVHYVPTPRPGDHATNVIADVTCETCLRVKAWQRPHTSREVEHAAPAPLPEPAAGRPVIASWPQGRGALPVVSARDLPPCMCLRDNSEQLPLSPHVLRIYDREPVREYLHTRDVGLDVGDYSLEGMTGLVFIERKSPGDLWASLFGRAPDNSVGEAMFNVDRLRREFFRARDHARKTLLVEVELGSFEEPHPRPVYDCPACALEFGGEGARPACREHPPRTMVAYARRRFVRNDRRGKGPEENVLAILGFVVSFWTDYGVATQWEPGRRGAELWLGMTLTRIWNEAHGGDKARVARERGLALPWMHEQYGEHETRAYGDGQNQGGGVVGAWVEGESCGASHGPDPISPMAREVSADRAQTLVAMRGAAVVVEAGAEEANDAQGAVRHGADDGGPIGARPPRGGEVQATPDGSQGAEGRGGPGSVRHAGGGDLPGGDRAQDTKGRGVEEASDGEGHDSGERRRDGIPEPRPDDRRSCGNSRVRPEGDTRGAYGDVVADGIGGGRDGGGRVTHDAGEQGAEARTDGRGDAEAILLRAVHGPDDSDGGRGRATPPEATASTGEAAGCEVAGVVCERGGAGGAAGGTVGDDEPAVVLGRTLPLLTAAPVADLPCRCGGIGLGVAGFHYARAIGCCYGPAPRPCAIVAGQERASLDGSERVAVVALRDRLWRVQRLGVHGAAPGFHVEGMVLRYWPVLTREPRRDLLGVAATSDEHARRRAARERPAPAAKPRRRRAGA